MPTAGPTEYIDKKTGELRRLQSPRDYLLTEALPNAAQTGLLGIKSIIAYSIFGPVGLAVAAAGYVFARHGVLSGATRSHDQKYDSPFKADAFSTRYDLTQATDRQRFAKNYGHLQPKLMVDVLHMTKTLGMNQIPIIEVYDPVDFGSGKIEKELVNRYAGVATTSRPDGKNPVLMIGAGALQSTTPDEMRTILAHEMTHAKLNHLRQQYLHVARRVANSMLNTLLIAGAILGPLPLLPTLGFVFVTDIAQKAIENIRSRRREHLCDQGAALITGQTKEFASGLNKVSRALIHANSFLANRKRLQHGQPSLPMQEPGPLRKFILATHPDNKSRLARVADFGKKYPDFCARQKSKFAETFNAVARHEKKKPPQYAQAPQRRL